MNKHFLPQAAVVHINWLPLLLRIKKEHEKHNIPKIHYLA